MKRTYERKNKTEATAKQALPLAEEQTEALVESILVARKRLVAGSVLTGEDAVRRAGEKYLPRLESEGRAVCG
jgi:hypothetical protein